MHYTYPSLTLYLSHMNRYSSLGAQLATSKGHRRFRLRGHRSANRWRRLSTTTLSGSDFLMAEKACYCIFITPAMYRGNTRSKAWELSRKQQP